MADQFVIHSPKSPSFGAPLALIPDLGQRIGRRGLGCSSPRRAEFFKAIPSDAEAQAASRNVVEPAHIAGRLKRLWLGRGKTNRLVPMRSKAQFKSHPIHPMLVAFPIVFLYGAAIVDVVGAIGGWRSTWSIGAYLSVAAVAAGLAAGMPGLIDYLYIVPPKSSAKRRATWHMAVNLSALGMMALGWLFRDGETLRPGMITIALEAAALVLVTWGGWMGGTLVYRNQIGVDHRYAQAGKWREAAVEARSGTPAIVTGAQELLVGQMMLVHIGQRRIVLARTESGYAAFDDRCTHRGGSLADGVLACELVCCPWHGSQFNVRDGSVQSGPAEQSIGVYQVEEAGGEIQLIVPA